MTAIIRVIAALQEGGISVIGHNESLAFGESICVRFLIQTGNQWLLRIDLKGGVIPA